MNSRCMKRIMIFTLLILCGSIVWGSTVVQAEVNDDVSLTAEEVDALIMMRYTEEDTTTSAQRNIDDVALGEIVVDPASLPDNEFYRAKVTAILSEESKEVYEGFTEDTQHVEVLILNGNDKETTLDLVYGGLVSIDTYQRLSVGDKVVVVKNYRIDGSSEYFITEPYRADALLGVFLFFVALTLFFGRKKGLGSLLGLAFSVLVLSKFIVPQLMKGTDPLLITSLGTLVIAGVSLFLAHGFHKRTLASFFSTMLTLLLALGLSDIFVRVTDLFGKGTEEAFFLQSAGLGDLNLRGLLLAGIVIGTLGVLDDITTAQTAVVGELRQANQSLNAKELYHRAIVVGREHIASLVNTLVLAYAGTALPLFILFQMNESTPLWMTFNTEMIAEEIVRTIIGSSALILAVPISTIIAVYLLKNETVEEGKKHRVHRC